MKKNTIKKTIIVSFLSSFLLFISVSADMQGGNYEIYSDNFSIISSQQSSGGIYSLYESAGDPFATTTEKGQYELRGGFQAQEKGVLKVNISKNTVDLGELSDSTVSSDSLEISVFTDSETGYMTTIREDGDLRSGGDSINDVNDGNVTSGSEEYGINTFGSDGLLSNDTAINGTVNLASHNGKVDGRSTEVIFKASIDSNTASGTYSHKVFFDTTVNP